MKKYILPLAAGFTLLFLILAAVAAGGQPDPVSQPTEITVTPTATPEITETPEPEPQGPTLEDIRTVTFVDVDPESREADCVSYAAYTGLLQGVGEDHFDGDSKVTRAMTVTVLYRLSGEEGPDYEGTFADVASGDWFAPAVAWAVDQGIARGTDDGHFYPHQPVNRQELAAFLYRFGAYADGNDYTGDLTGYTDGDTVPRWAGVSLDWALQNKLYAGMVGEVIHPDLPVSRTQLAQVLVALTAYGSGDALAQALTDSLRVEAAVTLSEGVHDLIQGAVEAAAKKYGATGVQVAVVHKGQVVDTVNYGWAIKNTQPMTADTKIRIASISKVSVAMGAMLLWEQGIIDPYESIGTYWGATVSNPYYKDKPVTVENLLTHTSSIRLFGDDASLAYNAVKSKLTSSAGFSQVVPGSLGAWGYNNYAFGVLGMTLELAAGRHLDFVLQDGLWSMMGIDAAFESGEIKGTDQLATIYRHDGSVGRSAEKAAQMFRPAAVAGSGSAFAGGLTISAKDQAKLVALLINDGVYEGVHLLSEASVEFMETPLGYVPAGYYQCHPLRYQEGMYGRERIYYHTGSAYGVYNLMTYDPAEGDGVVVLTTGASAATDKTGVYAVGGTISQAVYQILSGEEYTLVSDTGEVRYYRIVEKDVDESYVLVYVEESEEPFPTQPQLEVVESREPEVEIVESQEPEPQPADTESPQPGEPDLSHKEE